MFENIREAKVISKYSKLTIFDVISGKNSYELHVVMFAEKIVMYLGKKALLNKNRHEEG